MEFISVHYIFFSGLVFLLLVLLLRQKFKTNFYHSFIDYSSDWIWQINLKPVFTYSNQGVEMMLGYKSSEITGKHLYDFVPEWERDLLREKFHEHLISQKPLLQFHITAQHKDGSLVFLETNAVAYYKNGSHAGIRGVTRDITEYRLKEQEIEAQQMRLDLAQTGANMGIWDWKMSTEQVYFTPSYYTMMGYKPYEFPAAFSSWEELLHPEDVEKATAYVKAFILSDKNEFEIEFRMRTKAGGYRWILSRGKVSERDFAGKIGRMIGIHIDITSKKEYEKVITSYSKKLEKEVEERTKSLLEVNQRYENEIVSRKKAQETLTHSETFFINLIENLPIPVFVLNENDRVMIYNRSYVQLFDTGNQKVDYPSCLSEFPEKVANELTFAKDRLENLDDIHKFNASLDYRKGKKYLVYHINKLVYYGGEILLLGIIRDVTEVRNAEKELSKTLSMEKELNALRTQFISTVSHEFRTPLTGIRNVTQMLHRFYEKWEPAKRKEKVNQIYQSIDSMKGMLDDISLLGKELSGKLGYMPIETPLYDFIQGVTNEIANSNGHVQINTSFDEVLKPMHVFIDKTLLRQVLINLLNNAINYSRNHLPVNFKASTNQHTQEIIFVVEDFGIGIPAEDLPNIFLPFFRAENVKDRKGTGLGMAIVKKFTDIQNGKIDITSTQGKGTTITLTIPYQNNNSST